MYPKYLRLSTVIALAILVSLSVTTSVMGWNKWYSTSNPGMTQPPGQPPNTPWVAMPPGTKPPFDKPGSSIWIATDNLYVERKTKDWYEEVVIPEGDPAQTFKFEDARAYHKEGTSTIKSATQALTQEVIAGPPKKLRQNYSSDPQPDWTVVKITRLTKSGLADNVGVEILGGSECRLTQPVVSGQNVNLDLLQFGAPYETIRLTQMWFFHQSSQLDIGVPPTISAPPGSGTWSYEFVNVDPEGNPCPQGAIKWSTNGTGIESEQETDVTFSMAGQPYGLYTLYVYDAVSGKYERHVIPATSQIPTLTEWMLIIFVVLLAGWMAFVVVRRWKASQAAA